MIWREGWECGEFVRVELVKNFHDAGDLFGLFGGGGRSDCVMRGFDGAGGFPWARNVSPGCNGEQN